MINADKFEQVFGIYATELWAKPEKEFLEWLNSEAQEVKDISIPSAERTGHWIKDGHHIICDQCGATMCDTDREGDPIPRDFCPSCGVRMVAE